MYKNILAIGIIILFIITAVTPIALGNNDRTTDNKMLVESYKFGRYLYPEFYDCYNIDEIPNSEKYIHREYSDNDNNLPETVINPDRSPQPAVSPPMDSPWPMYCHDVRHTGRSPYSTADNLGIEKWRFNLIEAAKGSPAIDNNGDIYIGASHVFAIYPNGTLKWELDRWIETVSAPAIDENGVLYVGSIWAMPNYMYAIYTSNGTIKWKYKTGDHVESSPVIGDDGIIYFGDWSGNIHAVYQNGTRKWKYKTGDVVTSSPAIGMDGTIYVGSHDNCVYAFYPNGTVKWKFNTGSWVHGSPTIGDDGNVYIGSDNGKLYALYPNNGTMIWDIEIGATWCSPTLDEDGTLYVGVFQEKVYAVYPNGTVKWRYDALGRIWFGESIAISADGTLYFGTTWMDGGKERFIVLNSDGTERWIKGFGGIESSPAIGEDGTVYVGSNNRHLYAFGPLDPDAPSAPVIDGPKSGRVGIEYDFTFKSASPIGNNVYYWVEWGDGDKTDWVGPYNSGEEITESHTWYDQSIYTIKARAKDTDNLWGPWSTFEVNIPRNKATYNSLFLRFLERFPLLERLLFLIKVI